MQSVVGVKEEGSAFWQVVLVVLSEEWLLAALSVALRSCSACILHASPAVRVSRIRPHKRSGNPKTYHPSKCLPLFAAIEPATPAGTATSTATRRNKIHQRSIDLGSSLPPSPDHLGLKCC